MKRIQFIQHLTWLIIALLLPANALAGNRDENDIPWYQVEIIIFANLNQQGMVSETWPEPLPVAGNEFHVLTHPDDASLRATSGNKLPNLKAGTLPTPFELLPASELQLTPISKKLANSANYKPLLHLGWRQPTLHPDKSIPTFIYMGVDQPAMADAMNNPSNSATNTKSGSRFSQVALSAATVDPAMYGQLMSPSAIDTQTGPELNALYGTLRLSVSRYLHLETNLNYRTQVVKEEMVPVNMEDAIVGSGFQQNVAFTEQGDTAEMKLQSRKIFQNFNMYETRRMRSKEVHYFDHPLLGIIVRVVPYEIIPKEPDFDPASQAFTSGSGGSGGQKPTVKSPQ